MSERTARGGRRTIGSMALALAIEGVLGVLADASSPAADGLVRERPVTAIRQGTPTPTASAVPSISRADLDGFEPSIRQQVLDAIARATAQTTAETLGDLGTLLHAYDRVERAAACYAAAAALAPRTFDWPYYRGVALATSGDADRAAESFHKALAIRPTDVPARVRLADLRLEAGRFDDSAALYRAVLAERPDTAAAHYGLARVLAERNDPAAVGHLERAIALAPAFGPAHYALALAYQRQGNRPRADAALVRFRAARSGAVPLDDPLLERVAARRSGPYEDLARGRFLSQQGRPLEAIAALERALAANPQLIQAHVNLVAAYAAAGRPEDAEGAFRSAVALGPDLPEAHYNLGVLRLSQQRTEEAIAAFERALAANAFYADAHNNLGYLLAQGPRRAEAADHFRAALAASPEHRDAHFNLARLLLAERQMDEAITHFASAARPEDEKTALYLYALADACARRGQFDQAERHALAARSRAEQHGQQELVARIDEDLRRLKARRPPR